MPPIREVFGNDTQALFKVKTKNGCGIYTVHQSGDDDLPEQKTQIEIKRQTSLKEICKEFDIDFYGEE